MTADSNDKPKVVLTTNMKTVVAMAFEMALF
jgi:hypothetical protein